MNFGSLRLVLPTGEVRELLLELPQATVGRGEGATISIEDFSISRRHARLTVDSGRLLVEDAASAAGTFLDDEQLAPHTSYLVAPGASLRFGDVIAHFTPAPVQDATAGEAADDSPFGPGGLVVAMVSPAMPVDPGKTVTATATVTNRGRVVDEVELSVPELPADWYTIDTPQLSLVPGGRAEVTVTLHPPRRSDALAGDYVFSLSARSQEQQREEVAPGTFTLLPFTAVDVSLAAVRSKRHFRVFVENRGNEPVSYNLAGRDDAQAFSYGFERTLVSVLPGEKAAVALEVRRPREWFGPARNAPFEVVAAPPAGTELTARGQLAVHPPLQKFKMPVLAGFAV
ncbi:MAG TPA: FHA domain-containing protein, partial [Gemmatimonadaceae bacterium]|nr:FHA domain-containing protein [Gemmatimonadaceae bacterium]